MKKIILFILLSTSLYCNLDIYCENIKKGLDFFEVDSDKKEEIVEVLLQVRKKELEFPEMVQVVTAQDSHFFAYQVIAKQLFHERLEEPFEFLRSPCTTLFSNREDFFAAYPWLAIPVHENATQTELKGISDMNPEISKHIVSASLSMETCIRQDSALYVFTHGYGVVHGEHLTEENLAEYVKELFEDAGIVREVYEPLLEHLLTLAPISDFGIIEQIFIPKDGVSEVLYMSSPGGFLRQEQDMNILKTFEEFQEKRIHSAFDIHENFQVRLFPAALKSHGAQIYRYTLIPEEEQAKYWFYVMETLAALRP